jgi:hypothetical protein
MRHDNFIDEEPGAVAGGEHATLRIDIRSGASQDHNMRGAGAG